MGLTLMRKREKFPISYEVYACGKFRRMRAKARYSATLSTSDPAPADTHIRIWWTPFLQ